MRYGTCDIVIMAIVRRQMSPEGEILRGFCYGEDYMPRKPKRPCSYPGCPNLTDGRYCPEHQQKVNSNYEKYGRDKSTKKRYGRAWKRIRDKYASEHPFCELCFERGIIVETEEIHHLYSPRQISCALPRGQESRPRARSWRGSSRRMDTANSRLSP